VVLKTRKGKRTECWWKTNDEFDQSCVPLSARPLSSFPFVFFSPCHFAATRRSFSHAVLLLPPTKKHRRAERCRVRVTRCFVSLLAPVLRETKRAGEGHSRLWVLVFWKRKRGARTGNNGKQNERGEKQKKQEKKQEKKNKLQHTHYFYRGINKTKRGHLLDFRSQDIKTSTGLERGRKTRNREVMFVRLVCFAFRRQNQSGTKHRRSFCVAEGKQEGRPRDTSQAESEIASHHTFINKQDKHNEDKQSTRKVFCSSTRQRKIFWNRR